jgi:hypothetical protein
VREDARLPLESPLGDGFGVPLALAVHTDPVGRGVVDTLRVLVEQEVVRKDAETLEDAAALRDAQPDELGEDTILRDGRGLPV